jgi:hypothetical protein
LYQQGDKTETELAKMFGRSQGTVSKWIIKLAGPQALRTVKRAKKGVPKVNGSLFDRPREMHEQLSFISALDSSYRGPRNDVRAGDAAEAFVIAKLLK